MPSLKAIMERHGLGHVPYCVRCGRVTPHVEKAHIIDRMLHGLDTPANLAPLCGPCHRGQPMFQPGDEDRARDWFDLPALDTPALPTQLMGELAEALCEEIRPAGVRTRVWFFGTAGLNATLPPHPMSWHWDAEGNGTPDPVA